VTDPATKTVPEGARADEVPTEASKRPVYGDRYALEAEIGHGGMGTVFRARDLKLRRCVALKVLKAGAAPDPQRRERFEREALAAGALNHPNVLAVYDVGEHGGEPYLVSELLEGEALSAAIARGPLAPERVLDFALQLASGLAAAHQKGIVHRDLKPDNLFITGDGHLKILDFGIAKLIAPANDGPHTETGAVLGTPAYMSPEQLRAEPADARSDVFACGAVLYEMLSGRAPFQRATTLETAYAILHDPPTILPASPLTEVIARCLEKDPQARYANAEELLKGVRATTEGSRRAPGRRLRRRIVVIAALGLVTALGLAGVRGIRRFAAGKATPSIAVLPFADMSPGRDQEYLSDGIAEEILNALAHVEHLRVIGRTSSFSFKGKNEDLRSIGQKLDAGTLLEGSVRRSGDRIRITTQLIDAADGSHLWSETYDRKLADVFAVQEEIARAVVAALRLKLLPPGAVQRSNDPRAFEEFLIGRRAYSELTEDGYRRSIVAYERALAIDPSYAPAWAGIALSAHFISWIFARSAEEAGAMTARAREAAQKAIELGPDAADGYVARAYVRGSRDRDWQGALADVARALELRPDHTEALMMRGRWLLAPLGRFDEAIADLRKAIALDPLNPAYVMRLGGVLHVAGRRREMKAAADRALQMSPAAIFPWVLYALDAQTQGHPGEVLEIVRRPGFPERVGLALEAIAFRELGRHDEEAVALRSLVERHAFDGAIGIAWYYALKGDADSAFQWLERAATQREVDVTEARFDSFLSGLHTDARWKPFLRRLNLPAE
jgi:TolB-like protein/Tfp pilus assembly protein PilF